MRYLRPHGGYDLYHLYPQFLVDFLVTFGSLPEIPRELAYDNLYEDPHAQFEESNETVSEVVDEHDQSHSEDIDAAELLIAF